MKCRLDTGRLDDLGVFIVHTYISRPPSTGVTLVLEDEFGVMTTRTVANHQIEWIADES